MWINALDMSLNCRCKRDDLMCKSKTCYVTQEDDEEWDTVDDNIEIIDWEKRWANKLRLIPSFMDSSYEYYPDFGSSSTISVKEENAKTETVIKAGMKTPQDEQSDEEVYIECYGSDPESENSSEDIYHEEGFVEQIEDSDGGEVTYGSDLDLDEIDEEPEEDEKSDSKYLLKLSKFLLLIIETLKGDVKFIH